MLLLMRCCAKQALRKASASETLMLRCCASAPQASASETLMLRCGWLRSPQQQRNNVPSIPPLQLSRDDSDRQSNLSPRDSGAGRVQMPWMLHLTPLVVRVKHTHTQHASWVFINYYNCEPNPMKDWQSRAGACSSSITKRNHVPRSKFRSLTPDSRQHV